MTQNLEGMSRVADEGPEAVRSSGGSPGETWVVVLVPRRRDNGPRDRLWAHCRAWWEQTFPDWPIYEGHHDVGPFNRSAAINRAATMAGDWDVAIIIDSDVLGDPARIMEAVTLADKTGAMTFPFTTRKDLDQAGTAKVLDGFRGSWERYVHKRWAGNVSSIIAVPRRLWDAVDGFDENFVGWGFEDNAFASACVTFGGPYNRLPGEVWHLWHPTAKAEALGSPTFVANKARAALYHDAIGNPIRMRELRLGPVDHQSPVGIPRILHRVVPEKTSPQVEEWWAKAVAMHPTWEHRTWRDPLDPADFPLTSPHWPDVKNGAQLADLVRLEVLLHHGGVYIDSDVEPYRPFDALLPLSAFACWEDAKCIPNAVLGAAPDHPAIRLCLQYAIERMGIGTWEAGPGVTTEVLAFRPDVLTLPPGSFFPYHYKDKKRRRDAPHMTEQPWAFAAHHWAGSWLPEDKRW